MGWMFVELGLITHNISRPCVPVCGVDGMYVGMEGERWLHGQKQIYSDLRG